MKLSDYVIDFLAKKNIRHAFLVSGGAVVHLIDSAARHPKMMCIPVQHEESGAAAADMYARVTRNLGLALSTSGPGATNMVTSVCNAYFDSIPMLILTGQVARFRIKKKEGLRQRGFQETDVVSIFKSITKYTALVMDPKKIRCELEKALFLATEGRPGPVVLDIPDDLQREDIEPEKLEGFTFPVKAKQFPWNEDVKIFLEMIKSAKRPVVILGAGVHAAQAENEALFFIRKFQLPTVLTWGGADLLEEKDSLNMGRVGVCGPRGGNFALQFSDLVIALGTRLSQMITGGKQNLFAPDAKKIMVDVDKEELEKFGKDTFVLDLPIQADLKDFLSALSKEKIEESDFFSDWRSKIQSWNKRYPVCNEKIEECGMRINPYFFIKRLSKVVEEDQILIGDTGANLSWFCQAFEFKKGQRIFSAWNHTPMGYSLPASVGAACALDKTIICLIGDGGLMMCVQELATIRRFDLPVKIFLFDNQGHGIQKQTLDTWLSSRYVAVDVSSGLYFPDYKKLAESFGIPFFSLKNEADVLDRLGEIYHSPGPFLCNVEVIVDQKIVPMLKFGSGLQDLSPNLSPDEVERIRLESLNTEYSLI